MDTEKLILKLQLITLFDSISFGLIYAFLAPYLMVLGGDNVTTGMLAVSTLICELISINIAKDLIKAQGKRDALFTMFSIGVVSHVLLVLTRSYWFTIFARCLFSLTNQTQNIVKDLLVKKVSEDEVDYHLMVCNILRSSGFLIGPIVTGCLFNIGFSLSCILAAFLTLLSACLVLAIPKEKDDIPTEGADKSLIEQTVEQVSKTMVLFRKSNYKKNWDLLALKYLYISSVTIFFAKFPQILIYNFNADASVVGYTTSYMNAVTYIATYLAVTLKNKYEHVPMSILIYQGLLITFCSLLAACYAPVYTVFALACIPIIFARNYINTVWEKLYSNRKNNSLNALNDCVGLAAGLSMPLLFGVVCNIIRHNAVIIFSVIPIMISLYIFNTYTCKIKSLEEDADKTKNE
ncbi:major facilitator superfamily domain-containing protein 9 isoform X1 [Leptinotarsa decemlineata]|uniref:major facilitator superfamily domain-containing protein 9 isoform X1 n=2 Tax=Leptinotarsa decemlineata TaxID=7539 RepID=UPI003D308CA6